MKKIRLILVRLYLSLLTLTLLVGVGFLLIGLPMTYHDFSVTEEAKNCFNRSAGNTITTSGVEYSNDPKDFSPNAVSAAEKCRVSLSIADSKIKAYSKDTWIDNSPSYSTFIYSALFAFGFAIFLVLFRK